MTRLERLAMELPLPGLSIAQKADFMRAYLHSEIERKLRDQAARDERKGWSEQVACAKCETTFEVSRRRARAGPPICPFCRKSDAEPDESDRRWVAQIPNERLGNLLAAVESLRRQI